MKKLITGYTDIEEFKSDFNIYLANQSDRMFMQAVTSRVNLSSPEMVIAIKDELINALMETNPLLFIKRVSVNMDPKCWMIIKSSNDPFFEA